MEADVVASDLRFSDIIPQGCHKRILWTIGRIQRNEILHDQMVINCTREVLTVVCSIITAKESYPRMKALGAAMKKSMETGLHVCVCVYACVFMCVRVCMCLCVFVCVMTKPYFVAAVLTILL